MYLRLMLPSTTLRQNTSASTVTLPNWRALLMCCTGTRFPAASTPDISEHVIMCLRGNSMLVRSLHVATPSLATSGSSRKV